MRHRFALGGIALLAALVAGSAWAKLPPPTPEQQAKAAEAKEKAAEAAKKEAAALSKVQDEVVARYAQQQKAKGLTVKPTPIAAATPAAAPGNEKTKGGPAPKKP